MQGNGLSKWSVLEFFKPKAVCMRDSIMEDGIIWIIDPSTYHLFSAFVSEITSKRSLDRANISIWLLLYKG